MIVVGIIGIIVSLVATLMFTSSADPEAGGKGHSEQNYTRLPVYLQGYQQGQLLCPGAALSGRVSKVIVDPAAATVGAPGDCTLADMRQANPDTDFFAYVDVAAMRPVNSHQGFFQNTCADPYKDGRKYTIESENSRVATNSQGQVTYPDYDYLVVADLSAEYADTCVEAMKNMLSEASAPGVATDAEPTRFDGIMLDDVSMTPAHQQDMLDVGQWGPWRDDASYGKAMIDMVNRIDAGLDSAMGRNVPLIANLGLDTEDSTQVKRATGLAQTGALDYALREFTVATGSGDPRSDDEIRRFMRLHRQLAEAGLPIIQHDYSIPLRQLSATEFEQGRGISPDARCLRRSDKNMANIRQVASQRRVLDHRMLLGHTLLARTEHTAEITSTLSQAEPFCQTTAASSEPLAENVDDASVRADDIQIRELTRALNQGAYALGDPRETNGIWHQRLSTGKVVLVNTRTHLQRAVLYGHHYEVPGRSAIIDQP